MEKPCLSEMGKKPSDFACVFLFTCVYVTVWTVCMPGGHGGQQGVGSSGIGVTGGCELLWVLGTESGSSAGTASTLSHRLSF